MKLAVIGSRTFDDYKILCVVIDQLKEVFPISTIVTGGAKGADSLAEKYAYHNKLALEIYKPDWEQYGKSAGFIRNSTIWDNSDMGIAFWDGMSKGTAHSFNIAKKQNKKLYIFNYVKFDLYEN